MSSGFEFSSDFVVVPAHRIPRVALSSASGVSLFLGDS